MAKFDLIGGKVEDKSGALKTMHAQVSIDTGGKGNGKITVKKRRSKDAELDTKDKRVDWLSRGFHFLLD